MKPAIALLLLALVLADAPSCLAVELRLNRGMHSQQRQHHRAMLRRFNAEPAARHVPAIKSIQPGRFKTTLDRVPDRKKIPRLRNPSPKRVLPKDVTLGRERHPGMGAQIRRANPRYYK